MGTKLQHKKACLQARGIPRGSFLPGYLLMLFLKEAKELKRREAESLLDGYQQMAADQEQEAEAEEWTEGLIGDAY